MSLREQKPYSLNTSNMAQDSIPTPAPEKKWFQSWTVWFNVAVLVLTSVNEFAKVLPIPAELVTLALTVGNLLLRIKTTLPVKF